MSRKVSLLIDESPLMVLPRLACLIGLNEAIVVQQIHYWIRNIEKDHRQKRRDEHFFDGHYWTRGTYKYWQQENFPFWSEMTIKRICNSLRKKKILIAKCKGRGSGIEGRKLWYRINHDELEMIEKSGQPRARYAIEWGKKKKNLLDESVQIETIDGDHESGLFENNGQIKLNQSEVHIEPFETDHKLLIENVVENEDSGEQTSSEISPEISLENKVKESPSKALIDGNQSSSKTKTKKIDKDHFERTIDYLCGFWNMNKNISSNRKEAGSFLKQIINADYGMIANFAFYIGVIYNNEHADDYPFAWRFSERHWLGRKGGRPNRTWMLRTWGQWFNGSCFDADDLKHLRITQQEIDVLSAVYGPEVVTETIVKGDMANIVEKLGDLSHYEIVMDNVHQSHINKVAKERSIKKEPF